jgi:hypothetical protein
MIYSTHWQIFHSFLRNYIQILNKQSIIVKRLPCVSAIWLSQSGVSFDGQFDVSRRFNSPNAASVRHRLNQVCQSLLHLAEHCATMQPNTLATGWSKSLWAPDDYNTNVASNYQSFTASHQDHGDNRLTLTSVIPKALRTRSYSKETELFSDSNHQLITNWLVTQFRTRSYSIVTELWWKLHQLSAC